MTGNVWEWAAVTRLRPRDAPKLHQVSHRTYYELVKVPNARGCPVLSEPHLFVCMFVSRLTNNERANMGLWKGFAT